MHESFVHVQHKFILLTSKRPIMQQNNQIKKIYHNHNDSFPFDIPIL